jgi:hypothetical protein
MVDIIKTKELLRCRRCDRPLAKRDGDTLIITRPQDRHHPKTVVKVSHSMGGVVSVGCDECEGLVTPHYFITLVADQAISR